MTTTLTPPLYSIQESLNLILKKMNSESLVLTQPMYSNQEAYNLIIKKIQSLPITLSQPLYSIQECINLWIRFISGLTGEIITQPVYSIQDGLNIIARYYINNSFSANLIPPVYSTQESLNLILSNFTTAVPEIEATPWIYDQFTDTNGVALTTHTIAPINTPSATWSNIINGMTINNNSAKPNADSADNLALCNSNISDGIFSVRGNAINKENVLGITFRGTNSSNIFIFLRADISSPRVFLFKVEGGSSSNIGQADMDWIDGMELSVIANGTSINCYVNALPVISNIVSSFNQSATLVGLSAVRTTHKLDNFTATKLIDAPNGALRKFVFCGDSITSGQSVSIQCPYPNQLLGLLFPETPILKSRGKNLGESGRRASAIESAQGTAANNEYSADYKDNICIVMIGTNDLFDSTSPNTILGYISNFCLARRNLGYKVVVCTILPRTDFSGTKETNRLTLNSLIIANYASFATTYVDSANATGLTNAADTSVYPDGLHLSVIGNGYLATAIANVVSTII